MRESFELVCNSCGTHTEVRPQTLPEGAARECLVCPVCWATGAALEDAFRETGAAESGGPIVLGGVDNYRLLGCVRPGGPELEGATLAERELARLLWSLSEA